MVGSGGLDSPEVKGLFCSAADEAAPMMKLPQGRSCCEMFSALELRCPVSQWPSGVRQGDQFQRKITYRRQGFKRDCFFFPKEKHMTKYTLRRENFYLICHVR